MAVLLPYHTEASDPPLPSNYLRPAPPPSQHVVVVVVRAAVVVVVVVVLLRGYAVHGVLLRLLGGEGRVGRDSTR